MAPAACAGRPPSPTHSTHRRRDERAPAWSPRGPLGRSGPDVARNWQRGEIGVGDGRLRLQAHLIQEPVDLPQVLGRVPGSPLHEIVSALRTVVGVDSALAPPGFLDIVGDPAAHRIAVASHRVPVNHRGGGALLEHVGREVALLARVHEGGADPEDVEAELMHRPVTAGLLHAEMLARNLPHGALGRREHPIEQGGKLGGSELLALAVARADQLREGLGIPAVDEPVAHDGGGHAGDAEDLEVLASLWLCLDVVSLELHSPGRKQLFRLSAGASPLPVVDAWNLFGYVTACPAHCRSPSSTAGCVEIAPRPESAGLRKYASHPTPLTEIRRPCHWRALSRRPLSREHQPLPPGGPRGGPLHPGRPRRDPLPPSGPRGDPLPRGGPQRGALPRGGPRRGSLAPSGPRGGTRPPDGPRRGSLLPSGRRRGTLAPGGPPRGWLPPGGPRRGTPSPSGPPRGPLPPGGPRRGSPAPGGRRRSSLPPGGPRGGSLCEGPSGGDQGIEALHSGTTESDGSEP